MGTENRLVPAKWEGFREDAVSRCKLLYMEWTNKGPLCSTDNYMQHPMTNFNGKEY